MNFDWEALLDVANDWFAASPKETGHKREALLRSVASRAYYAAFGAASVWIQKRHPDYRLPSHGEVHQAVADYFLYHREVEFQEIGEKLGDMRAVRNSADYRLRLDNSRELAELNLFDANRVLNALAGLEA